MISLLGVVILLLVAVGLSSNRAAMQLRTVGLAFALQVTIGFVGLLPNGAAQHWRRHQIMWPCY